MDTCDVPTEEWTSARERESFGWVCVGTIDLTIVKFKSKTQHFRDVWFLSVPTPRGLECYGVAMRVNRQVVLAARPIGVPKESDFQLAESEIPKPSGGEVLVETKFLSVDPYVRSRLTGITT